MTWFLVPFLRRLLACAAVWAVAGGACVAQVDCESRNVTVVTTDTELAEFLCEQVDAALTKLAACNVTLTHPLTITLNDNLSPGCMGVYHCGEERIELLTLKAMQALRSPDRSLAFLETPVYFQSILTHELAHAAYSEVPCPFGACPATSEYVANTMQVMSLPARDLARFEATLNMQSPVPRDSVSWMLYQMAPDLFLRRAWIHLNQRPDPCAYIGQMMDGRIVLDKERFD